jgi:hypothetical protein
LYNAAVCVNEYSYLEISGEHSSLGVKSPIPVDIPRFRKLTEALSALERPINSVNDIPQKLRDIL